MASACLANSSTSLWILIIFSDSELSNRWSASLASL